MKDLIYLLLVTLPLGMISDDWVSARIDKIVSVSFPVKPEKEKSAGSIVLTSDNEHCVFMVTAAELLPEGIPLENITDEQEDKFLNGVLNGSLKAFEGKEDAERKRFTINNIRGIEMSYTGNFPTTEIKMKSYKRVFRIDRTVYAFDCWIIESENEGALSDKEKFFNSVTATLK